MNKSDFFYDLPEELIAQDPLCDRASSRLLVLDKESGKVGHHHFYDIADMLNPGDCLVLNNSRVLPARLIGHRPTGGVCEVLLLQDRGDNVWECLVRPGRKLKVGAQVIFGDGLLTAVQLISTLIQSQKPLSRLASVMTMMPQSQYAANVDDRKKYDFDKNPIIAAKIAELEASLVEEEITVEFVSEDPVIVVEPTAVPELKACSVCGTPCNSRFCPECGAAMGE